MAHCSSCSAPLPPNSIICEYCGSRNDTDLAGIHYYTTHKTDSGRTCPRCSVSLRTINLKADGKFLIERCDQCCGLFFDPGELEALLDSTVSNVFEINRVRLDSINKVLGTGDYAITYIKCPVCCTLMNRMNFGAKSGVIVDRCKDHGVWLDGGELRHLFEWMKAGGKLLHQEKLEEEKKRQEKERDLELRKKSMDSATGRCPAEDDSSIFGGTSGSDTLNIVDVVATVVRFFTRI
ncbi:zf-TFIIB domain-containing protein [Pelotalea chapellei]|uniref:Zf-TFIIB domain-containing protein n=1 Tax=Pelotalea chapellei TaxID=44671 RepID=A0ABS5UCS3_9BACT|nr:zf-TFIIB domain-containing protein [Pelotalea chapellei]